MFCIIFSYYAFPLTPYQPETIMFHAIKNRMAKTFAAVATVAATLAVALALASTKMGGAYNAERSTF